MRFLLRPICWFRGHRLEFGSIYLLEPLDVDPGTGVETELSETEGVPYAKKCSRCGGFVQMPGLLKILGEPEPPEPFDWKCRELDDEDEKELVDLEDKE